MSVPPDDLAPDYLEPLVAWRVWRVIERSGSAMFEVGDLGTQGSRVHQLALKRMSGRNDGTGQSKWVVFESGQPGKGVPASATPFPGQDGLKNALAHLAQMSQGDLSGFVPSTLLRPLNGGGGIDLNEGHVRTEHLRPDELQEAREIPPEIVAGARHSPYKHDPERFHAPATPADTPSRRAATAGRAPASRHRSRTYSGTTLNS